MQVQLFTSVAGIGVGDEVVGERVGEGPVGGADPGQCGLPQGVL